MVKATTDQIKEAFTALAVIASKADPMATYIVTAQLHHGSLGWTISHHRNHCCTVGTGKSPEAALADLESRIGGPVTPEELRAHAEVCVAAAEKLERTLSNASA